MTPLAGDLAGTSARFLLVGDVGGTNARFAIHDAQAEPPGGRLRLRATLAAAEHAHFADAVRAFLAAGGIDADKLRGASFAVACPLGEGEVRFTNSPWRFMRDELQRQLGLPQLVLINDFEALALSVPEMPPAGLLALRDGQPLDDSPRLVLGPGTGLGVAGLVPVRLGDETLWRPVPGEGGHVAFAPVDDFEAELLQHLRGRHPRVSVERIVCGDGLVALHAFLLQRSRAAVRPLSAAEITRDALAGEPLAREAVMRFLAVLGSFAGDCSLLYAARGGVYFGGGILPRLRPLLAQSPLIERFDAKGRMSHWVSRIPLHLIIDDAAALRGAAMAAGI